MDAATLARAMGTTADVSRYVPAFNDAMLAAEVTTVRRAAMWCAQIGHESAGLRYMEEIADGSAYEGRRDLGNTQPGDGRRYKGSGPIQLTGRANFRAFTRWANAQGHTDLDFEAHPELVRTDPRWGFLAASWYWAVARPQLNTLADNGWIWDATRAINGGTNGIQDRIARYERCLALGDALLPTPTEKRTPVEKRLDYSRAEVHQDTYYWCGPATAQTIINSRTSQMVPESVLARELGTTVNGTNGVGQIARALEQRIGGGWTVVAMPNDPPSGEQRDRLWRDIRGSVDAGYGVAINIWAPQSNYPRASYTSTQSPAYSGGFVKHYIAGMGYAVDEHGGRHVWIADSGFAPYGYWITLDQLATLIPPREYAYPAAAVAATPKEDDMGLTPDQDRKLTEVHRELTQRYPSRSKYRAHDEPIDTLAGFVLNTDARIHEQFVERMAEQLGITPEEFAQALRDAVKEATR